MNLDKKNPLIVRSRHPQQQSVRARHWGPNWPPVTSPFRLSQLQSLTQEV